MNDNTPHDISLWDRAERTYYNEPEGYERDVTRPPERFRCSCPDISCKKVGKEDEVKGHILGCPCSVCNCHLAHLHQ